MKRHASIVIKAVLVLSILLFIGTHAHAEVTLTVARTEDLRGNLDPHNHFNLACVSIYQLVYGSLTSVTPDGKVIPRLATSWEVSDNAKTWTFNLRKGVTFHNGEPFNAEAVKFSIERIAKDKSLVMHFLWSSLEKTEIIDDYKISLKFSEPFGEVLYNASMYLALLPPKHTQEKGFDPQIGTGPFKFVEWFKGERYVLKRNDDWWGWGSFADTNIEKFIYKPIREDSTRMAALETGEADIVEYVTPELRPKFEKNPDIQIYEKLVWDRLWLIMNVKDRPFKDIAVRKAVKHAIDRDAICQHVYKLGSPIQSTIPKGVLGHNPWLVPYDYNPEKAKQMLADAGYPKGFEASLIGPIGWYPRMKEATQAIAAMLAEAGINAKITLLEGGPYKQRRRAGNYDLTVTGGSCVTGDTGRALRLRLGEQDVYSTGWQDEELYGLLAQAKSTTDNTIKEQLYQRVDSINHERGPFATFWQIGYLVGARSSVKNLKIHGGRFFWYFNIIKE